MERAACRFLSYGLLGRGNVVAVMLSERVQRRRASSGARAAFDGVVTLGRPRDWVTPLGETLVGDLELDCDVLTVTGSDLRITVYTAAAGSAAAERLEFLRVGAVHTVTP
ncbi:hypothetical protein [Micromonospora wenchangensis]|uniref:MmyB family transcriptional regulator n=1 Tax=Micromonospora wenchangensis TaxID=1185415 RepID=UPI003D72929D